MKPIFEAPKHAYLAPFDGGLKHDACATEPAGDVESKKDLKAQLVGLTRQLDEQQRMLYAQDRYAILLVFQALDAAGKDGTIRAVFNRIDPTGITVSSFKQPSAEELEHDFLWRTGRRLPRRGHIAVFNRSYYEEVLVVRVHPNYLQAQRLPPHENLDTLWQQRYVAIRDHERHLAESGTVVVKFWLKHSAEEQRQRFLSRLNEPDKHWKFSVADVAERGHWMAYMAAYQDAINATSRAWAPWYVIPADNKHFMRVCVAEILLKTLQSLDLHYPPTSPERLQMIDEMRVLLAAKKG